jgi:hypothetical protein
MTFYSDMADTALALLKEFGTNMDIRRTTYGAYDPNTGTASSSTVDLPTTGMLKAYKTRDIDNTLIHVGDVQVVLAASVKPSATDKIIIGTDAWTIVPPIQEMNPSASSAVVYVLQVRK